MWTAENRKRYDRGRLRYPSDLTDDEWQFIEPLIPPAKRGGRRREVNVREVMNRGHVRPEHGLPVAGDPEGLAAQKHSLRLLGFMVLRRHAGAYPLRALCQMPRAGGT